MAKTEEALAACREWLAQCIKEEWAFENLEYLEELWWKYHDDNGALRSANSGR